MAHVAKFKAGAMGHMLGHYSRDKEHLPDNINPERTAENYNLAAADQPLQQLDFIKQRLSEVKVQKRSDVNVLCDWVVTVPTESFPSYFPELRNAFFKETYNFLCERYGKENVVSAYVHMDEVTPHLHFAFLPIVKDKKHPEREKLSAKEKITRNDLKCFHEQLQAHLEREIGISVPILNEATKNGNKSIAELKRGTAVQQMEENKQMLEANAREAARRLDSLNAERLRLLNELEKLGRDRKKIKGEIESLDLQKQKLEYDIQSLLLSHKEDERSLSIPRSLFFEMLDSIDENSPVFDKLYMAALQKKELEESLADVEPSLQQDLSPDIVPESEGKALEQDDDLGLFF